MLIKQGQFRFFSPKTSHKHTLLVPYNLYVHSNTAFYDYLRILSQNLDKVSLTEQYFMCIVQK